MIGYWATARAWLLPYGMLVWVAYVAVLLREGGEQKRKETVQNSPPPLLYGKWVTGWWVRQEAHVATGSSEATQLWRKGKTQNTDIHREQHRKGGWLLCSQGIMPQHLRHTNAPCFHGKQERGWGEAEEEEEEERRWMLTYTLTVMDDSTVAFAGLFL